MPIIAADGGWYMPYCLWRNRAKIQRWKCEKLAIVRVLFLPNHSPSSFYRISSWHFCLAGRQVKIFCLMGPTGENALICCVFDSGGGGANSAKAKLQRTFLYIVWRSFRPSVPFGENMKYSICLHHFCMFAPPGEITTRRK